MAAKIKIASEFSLENAKLSYPINMEVVSCLLTDIMSSPY